MPDADSGMTTRLLFEPSRTSMTSMVIGYVYFSRNASHSACGLLISWFLPPGLLLFRLIDQMCNTLQIPDLTPRSTKMARKDENDAAHERQGSRDVSGGVAAVADTSDIHSNPGPCWLALWRASNRRADVPGAYRDARSHNSYINHRRLSRAGRFIVSGTNERL